MKNGKRADEKSLERDQITKGKGSFEGKKRVVTDSKVELVNISHNIARKILPVLIEQGIPITPANYRLWYEYYSGEKLDLQTAMNHVLAEGKEFTPEVTEKLYRVFFSHEASEAKSKTVERVSSRLQTMTVELVKMLLVSMAGSSEYRDSLGRYVASIEKASDLRSVKKIVAEIVSKTGNVIESQSSFVNQLENAARDIEDLHHELRRQEELTHKDELTGLYNRRAFNGRLKEEVDRSRRSKAPLAMIMLDLDDFKSVNDDFGHLVGDRLLQKTAKVILNSVRLYDFTARFGGEEFAVICPETNLAEAVLAAERIREAMSKTNLAVKGRKLKVTTSLGVTVLRRNDEIRDFLERVDKLLYRAKQQGKNRVCSEE